MSCGCLHFSGVKKPVNNCSAPLIAKSDFLNNLFEEWVTGSPATFPFDQAWWNGCSPLNSALGVPCFRAGDGAILIENDTAGPVPPFPGPYSGSFPTSDDGTDPESLVGFYTAKQSLLNSLVVVEFVPTGATTWAPFTSGYQALIWWAQIIWDKATNNVTVNILDDTFTVKLSVTQPGAPAGQVTRVVYQFVDNGNPPTALQVSVNGAGVVESTDLIDTVSIAPAFCTLFEDVQLAGPQIAGQVNLVAAYNTGTMVIPVVPIGTMQKLSVPGAPTPNPLTFPCPSGFSPDAAKALRVAASQKLLGPVSAAGAARPIAGAKMLAIP